MSELRQDPTTGVHVIVAPGRSDRPNGALAARQAVPSTVPRFDPACPFCPGNEAQLPGIVAETAAPGVPGWAVRVVPNKYPALLPEPPPLPADAYAGTSPGYGMHEVLIESPLHCADLTTMDDTQIATVLASYHDRFCALSAKPGIASVVLFRNHGARSGASLVHPHAQAIALPMVPPQLHALFAWGEAEGRATGACPTCTFLAHELQECARVVEATGSFVALVPYAAQCPFEQWIVPARHQHTFAVARGDELRDLGHILRRSLQRLKAVHGGPPYSFTIESAPPDWEHARFVHWRLRIVPDLIDWGGFERGAGMPINSSAPEADAARLREAGIVAGGANTKAAT
jgi:UDPglucose--hexose-1-phosphate uridylyltransferase